MRDIDLTTHGELPPYAPWYAAGKLRPMLRYSPQPVAEARVRLHRRDVPGRHPSVLAEADLDIAGQPLHAAAEGVSAREAVDRLHARLRLMLPRIAGRQPVRSSG